MMILGTNKVFVLVGLALSRSLYTSRCVLRDSSTRPFSHKVQIAGRPFVALQCNFGPTRITVHEKHAEMEDGDKEATRLQNGRWDGAVLINASTRFVPNKESANARYHLMSRVNCSRSRGWDG
ncbi:hypothetical protein BDV96DRAFT_118122 [Lophiotrema nucula]|uniref:Secreted protein n=1 Tax=Lophiotrema nucula TaxID=690887 RepID=A0A6A5Z316_9PLEO|nr:hypothetical protein BDV96DRAFT_118122 [Lophiotrema nucula]